MGYWRQTEAEYVKALQRAEIDRLVKEGEERAARERAAREKLDADRKKVRAGGRAEKLPRKEVLNKVLTWGERYACRQLIEAAEKMGVKVDKNVDVMHGAWAVFGKMTEVYNEILAAARRSGALQGAAGDAFLADLNTHYTRLKGVYGS
jgi:hypothetical protein